MSTVQMTPMDAALTRLLRKYAVPAARPWHIAEGAYEAADDATFVSGDCHADDPSPGGVPLMPWRAQRRFVELRNLVLNNTVEQVCMIRSRCFASSSCALSQLLYREFDLSQWILQSGITRIFAAMSSQRTANVIATFANGIIAGIEISASLPDGARMIDRHECIARRGVASDQVVDALIRTDSVYLYRDGATMQYTDTDAELFGFADDQIALIRSAYGVIADPGQAALNQRNHAQLVRLVELAMVSDRERRALDVPSADKPPQR